MGSPKKPYNIKLDSKSKLFGMEKAKKWCLIANYEDLSLLRDQIVYNLGADIGMPESPDVEVLTFILMENIRASISLQRKLR